MSALISLVGQKFGRLTVISRAENNKGGRAWWHCRCDCGNETIVLGRSLRSGNTKSCGCLQREKTTTHGMINTRLYSIWHCMKKRCFNRNGKAYKNYGGRGIHICKEWLDREKGFINFYNWAIANGYSDELSIDRINVNGNYEPSNCRWATRQMQVDNRRCSKPFTYEGVEYKSIAECARQLGIPRTTLWRRAKKTKREGKKENE